MASIFNPADAEEYSATLQKGSLFSFMMPLTHRKKGVYYAGLPHNKHPCIVTLTVFLPVFFSCYT